MKRMHIHVKVNQLADSIKFYSALFGSEPTKTKSDYAKWMLDDPRINFAISTGETAGVDHLGLQVESEAELSELRERLQAAEMAMFDEGETVCCYARSDKSWVQDPSGTPWEAYQTMADAQMYKSEKSESTCCAPAAVASSCGTQAASSCGTSQKSACC